MVWIPFSIPRKKSSCEYRQTLGVVWVGAVGQGRPQAFQGYLKGVVSQDKLEYSLVLIVSDQPLPLLFLSCIENNFIFKIFQTFVFYERSISSVSGANRDKFTTHKKLFQCIFCNDHKCVNNNCLNMRGSWPIRFVVLLAVLGPDCPILHIQLQTLVSTGLIGWCGSQ